MNKLSLFYPIKPYTIFQGFGECLPEVCDFYKSLGLAGHNGNDVPCSIGTPVYAAHEGEVTYAGVDSQGGYGVVIRTLQQFEDINGVSSFWKTIYWHLIKDIPVRVGQQVAPRDIIGYGDTTGHALGSHLHFGLKPIAQGENEWTWYNINQNNGYLGAVDPNPYFNGMYAQDTTAIINALKTLVYLLQKLIGLIKGRGGN